jgi:WD40 repeat protein
MTGQIHGMDNPERHQDESLELKMFNRWEKKFDDTILGLAYNDNLQNPLIAAACTDKNTYILDKNGNVLKIISAPAPCRCTKFMHNNHNVAVGTFALDNGYTEISCFDIEHERCNYTITYNSDTGCPHGTREIEFSNDNKLGASVECPNTAIVWDAREGKIIEEITSSNRPLRCVRFDAHNNLLLMTDEGTLGKHTIGKKNIDEIFSLAGDNAPIYGKPILSCDGSMFMGCIESKKRKKKPSLWLCNWAKNTLFELHGKGNIVAGDCTADNKLWISAYARKITAVLLTQSANAPDTYYQACRLKTEHEVSALACHQSQQCVVATWPNILTRYTLALKKIVPSNNQQQQ